MAHKSRDHFELVLEELLRSLEENGITFALKAVQQKAIKQLFAKEDLFSLVPSSTGLQIISFSRPKNRTRGTRTRWHLQTLLRKKGVILIG